MRPMKYLQPLRYFKAMVYCHTRYIIYIHIFIGPYIHIYRSVLRRKLMLPVTSNLPHIKKESTAPTAFINIHYSLSNIGHSFRHYQMNIQYS